MGPNIIGGMKGGVATADIDFAETRQAEAASVTGSIKINYGDAGKADRLMASLTKVQQMQVQAQTLIASRNPGFAGID
jgi:hypothetical protein